MSGRRYRPPRVTDTVAGIVVERITARHRDIDDRNLDRLGTDPRDVLDYLHRYDGRHLPDRVRRADVHDSLVLQAWLYWADRHRLRATLRHGRRVGLFWSELGNPLGIETPQGAKCLLDRLDAEHDFGQPDEKLTREARRAQAADDNGRDVRTAWVRAHRRRLHTLAIQLLADADTCGVDDREWLDELAADHATDTFTPATLSVLGLACGEIRCSDGFLALAATRNVHRHLVAADRLRTAFAGLG